MAAPRLTAKTTPKLVPAAEVARETTLPLSTDANAVPSTSTLTLTERLSAMSAQDYEKEFRPRNRPKSKQKAAAREIVKLKALGLTHAEIAERLGLTTGYIKNLVFLAGQNGWLSTTDVEERLKYSTAHKIVRNVDAALDGVVLGEGQQEMTIAAAKGLGFFKQHEAGQHEGPAASMVLGVKIEVVGSQQQFSGNVAVPALPPASTGMMGGTPSYVEAELVKESGS